MPFLCLLTPPPPFLTNKQTKIELDFQYLVNKHYKTKIVLLNKNTISLFVPTANFQPGVRYTFSLYSFSSEGRQLLQRWQGFVQELGKDNANNADLIFLVLGFHCLLFSCSFLSICYFQFPPVLCSCQPVNRTQMLSSPGAVSLRSTTEVFSWASMFTTAVGLS